MRLFSLTIALASVCSSQPLNGTRPLMIEGDPAAQMVEGIAKYLLRLTQESAVSRHPSRQRLKQILGVVDARVPFSTPELVATAAHSALLAETDAFRVFAVRWPVLDGL